MIDDAAFVEAWERFRPVGAKIARTRLRASAEEVEDVLGDVLVRAWAHREALARPGANQNGWLAQITTNVIRDILKHRRKLVIVPLPDEADDLFTSPLDDGYAGVEAALLVDVLARTLSPDQHDALLDLLDDLTIDEAMARRGQSRAAVKKLRVRVSERFRARSRGGVRWRGGSRRAPTAAPVSPAA